MSTLEERRANAVAGTEDEPWADGFARPRVFLQPIAAPSALGLGGFSVATLMVALIQAGWLGSWTDMPVVAIFCLTFGGIAQFTAGMWSYKARDIVATVAHGMWGSFWIAFGILNLLILAHVLPPAPHHADYALGLWFLGLAYMTLIPAIASLFHHLGVAAVLWTLATGSALTSVGWFLGGIGNSWLAVGGILYVISAGLAAYVVLTMCLTAITKRAILPSGELTKAANIPGRKPLRAIELDWAEPGVKMGQ